MVIQRSSRPIVEELTPPPLIADALRAFAGWPGMLLFDSALQHETLGRHSFLMANPVRTHLLEEAEFGRDPFAPLRDELRSLQAAIVPGLPPFQGGYAGLLSYELGGCLERLPRAAADEFTTPAMVVGLYDWVLAWDHPSRRAWIIVQPFAKSPSQRLDEVRTALQKQPTTSGEAIAAGAATAPVSNRTREEYLDQVQQVIEYIRAGDIFQANLSHRLTAETPLAATELYLQLRAANPAPFGAYFAHEDWAILSSSPERFMRLQSGQVETRPIKGTRRRSAAPEADLYTRDELRESHKDQAENVMIVDLLRNDLSRVCRPASIRVPQLCAVETYETVQHLVSVVQGELRVGLDFFDLLAATFPGGSITGAPKVRAMEIIHELEGARRGPYCGSLFWCGPDGNADSSILIRTMLHRAGRVSFGVGGGVIAQSDPAAEYNETLHKAAGMLRAIGSQ